MGTSSKKTSPANRRRAFIVSIVLAVAFAIYATNWNHNHDSGTTTPSGLDKAACTALYDARVGHDPNDNAFWQGLVECANAGLLPVGQNDPGLYGR